MLEGGGSRKQEWLKIDKNRRRTDTQPKTENLHWVWKIERKEKGLGEKRSGRSWRSCLGLFTLSLKQRGLDPGTGRTKVSNKTHFISHEQTQRV